MSETPRQSGDLEQEIAELRCRLEQLELIKSKYETLADPCRDNENRFRLVAENLSDTIWILDDEFRFTYVSQSVEKHFGYRAEKIIGLPLENFLTVSSYSTILNYYEEDSDKLGNQPNNTPITRTIEAEFRHQDGHYVLCEATVSVISDNDGNLKGFLGITRDITERKKAENALKNSENKYRAIFDSASDGIIIHNYESGDILDVNKRMCELFGYTREEMRALSSFVLVADDQKRPEQKYIPEAFPELWKSIRDKSYYQEWHAKDKNGREFWADFTLKSITIDKEKRVLAVVRDISKRKEAELALRESEFKYRTIFNSAGDGMFIFDYESGQMLDANPRLCEMLGYTRDELLLAPPLDLIAEDQILPGPGRKSGGFLDLWREIRDKSFFKEWHAKHKNGTKFWVDFSLKQVIIEKKKQVLAVVRDITERREAELALKESETKYRTIFNSANDAVFIHDFDTGKIVDVNDKAVELYGYSRNELINSDNLLITAADQIEFYAQYYPSQSYQEVWKLIARDKFFTEWHALDKNGREFWVEVNLKTVILGGVKRIMAIVRDITERKKALEAIEERDIRLRRFVEDAGDAVMSVDIDGRIILASKRVADYVGIETSKLIGKSLWEIFAKEMAGAGITEMKHAIKNGEIFSQDYPVSFRGENRWYNVMVRPMSRVADSNQVAHVFARDFTETMRVRIRDQARITLLNNLRLAKSIDDCLMFGCQAIYDSNFFKRAVLTIHNENREIINIGYIGIDKNIVEQARHGKAPDESFRRSMMQEKYRLSRSYFIPSEAEFQFDKSERYISSAVGNSTQEYSWKNGDEFFVPVLTDNNICEGWLSVDTPYDDRRPTVEMALLLEEIIDIVTKKIHEISSLQTLRSNSLALEESNIALRGVLASYERDKAEIKNKVGRFVSDILSPAVDRLSNPDGSINKAQYSILKTGLSELITSPDIAISYYPQLSPREIEICSMIKDGYSSKEIARTLHIALKTVHKHRQIIRRKLGIGKQKINICTFLSNHQLFRQ